MRQGLSRKAFAAILICGMSISSISLQICSAQGLEGDYMHSMRFGSGPGPLIPGKTANERWQLLLKQMPSLMGMKREEVIKLFGKGIQFDSENDEDYCIDDLTLLHLHFYKESLSKISIMKVHTKEELGR